MTADDYPDLELLIDGDYIPSNSRNSRAVIDPATGRRIGSVPIATENDMDRAAEAAGRAFLTWRGVPAAERAALLHTIARLIRRDEQRLATILTLEQGKPLAQARFELQDTADTFDWMAEECRRAYGRIVPASRRRFDQFVRLEPVGAVAAFSPWNFPALLACRKVATALAAGCTVVLKPAEETPGIMVAIAHLCTEAGLPAGVLNLLFGVPAQISTRLVASSHIKKISFTGSVAVGRELAMQAGAVAKKITLELGGHAPVIVMNDVDLDAVVAQTVSAKFRNAGQICVSPTRFIVHEAVHDQFLQRLTDRAKCIRVGNGLDATVEMGPLANSRRVDAMREFCEDAVAHGAHVFAGGRPPKDCKEGFFWEPTVIGGLSARAKAMKTEPFGPLALVSKFEALPEAIANANALDLGLAAYAFTNSLSAAYEIEHGLEAGNVSMNTYVTSAPEMPFSGIKSSGLGAEMGIEGLRDHLQIKSVVRALP